MQSEFEHFDWQPMKSGRDRGKKIKKFLQVQIPNKGEQSTKVLPEANVPLKNPFCTYMT